MVDIVIADIAVQINKDNMDLSSTVKTQNDLANSDKSKLNPKTMWAEMSADTFKTILEETNSTLNKKLKAAYTGAKGSNTTIEEGVNLLSPQIKSVEDKINSNNRGLAFNGKKLLINLAGAAMLVTGFADPLGVHNIQGNPIDLTPARPSLVEGSSNEILDKVNNFTNSQNPSIDEIVNSTNQLLKKYSETSNLEIIEQGDKIRSRDNGAVSIGAAIGKNGTTEVDFIAEIVFNSNNDLNSPDAGKILVIIIPKDENHNQKVSTGEPVRFIGNDIEGNTFEKSTSAIPELDKFLGE